LRRARPESRQYTSRPLGLIRAVATNRWNHPVEDGSDK
jgi:hypothetical protein